MRIVSFAATSLATFSCVLLITMGFCGSAARAMDYCVRDAQAAAVDLSAPVDQSFLNQMQTSGINTIIRYYDHTDETLPGKTLTRIERDFILANGFKIAVVFQHHNDRLTSFSWWRGRRMPSDLSSWRKQTLN